ncbi:MAG: SPOR domain-containing protein [Bacteroidales bacterium]|nr:SPOR domain-containing protein [Bacteroidales bacterium]
MMLATGCDFFRMLAGRPTSEDIEAKREEILRFALQQAQGRPQDDSVVVSGRADDGQRPYQASAGQSEATEATGQSDVRTEAAGPVRQVGGKTGEKKRFYVILGAFSSKDNALKYAERIEAYGYEPEFFGFTEGRTAVGVGGTDDQEEAKAFMRDLKRQDFCPEGVWILDRKRK